MAADALPLALGAKHETYMSPLPTKAHRKNGDSGSTSAIKNLDDQNTTIAYMMALFGSLKLLQMILAQLELRSVTNVQYINRRCTDLANSLPELRTIVRHGQNALRESLAIRTAATISVEKLL